MIVTVEWLKSLEACADQVKLFQATFGESVEVTKESLTRAHGAGLDLEWFGDAAFDKGYSEGGASALKTYKEAIALAWEVYQEAEDVAWKTYNKARGRAWRAARAENGKTYQEEVALARKVYYESIAPAVKAYDEVRHTAWKACNEALIEVILKLSQVTITP